MSSTVGTIEHVRGETIAFGLRAASPAYDGTEVVTCHIKAVVDGEDIPPSNNIIVESVTPIFVAASGDDAAMWHFTIPATRSVKLTAGKYILDAKVTYTDGVVDYPLPLGMVILEHVTS